MKKQMKIEEAILYCLASQNRGTSESRIKLAYIMPSEEEEDDSQPRNANGTDCGND